MTKTQSAGIRALYLIFPILVGGYIIKFLLDARIIDERIGVLLFFILLFIAETLWFHLQETRTS